MWSWTWLRVKGPLLCEIHLLTCKTWDTQVQHLRCVRKAVPARKHQHQHRQWIHERHQTEWSGSGNNEQNNKFLHDWCKRSLHRFWNLLTPCARRLNVTHSQHAQPRTVYAYTSLLLPRRLIYSWGWLDCEADKRQLHHCGGKLLLVRTACQIYSSLMGPNWGSGGRFN